VSLPPSASGDRAHEVSRLSSLIDAVVSVTGDLDVQTVLERIVAAACTVGDARYGALGVFDDDGQLVTFVHHGLDEDTAASIGEQPRGTGLLGHLARQPAAVRLDRLTEHDTSSGFPPGHPEMDSFLGVPIRVRNEVFGNLYLTDKRGGGGFDAEDEELLLGLAAVAGSTIEQARLRHQLVSRERWREAVLEVSTSALAGDPAAIVRERIATLGANLVHAQAASLVTRVDGRPWAMTVVGAGPVVGELGTGPGLAATVLVDGQPHRGRDAVVFDGRPALWVPLREGEAVLCALGVAREQPFNGHDERLLAGFAAQASLALTHERTQSDLARLSLVEDRERIGRDLHDTVIQRLFATGLSLQAVIRRSGDNPEVVDRLEQAVDDIDHTVKEIRSTIFALQSSEQSRRGARAEVLEVVEELTDILPRAPRVRFEGPIDTLVPPAVAEHLGPVVRESLTNVARHAAASDIELELLVDGRQLTLVISDDGKGLGEPAQRRVGFGLRNLGERAQSLGGRLTLGSRQSGGGTMLIWQVPLGI